MNRIFKFYLCFHDFFRGSIDYGSFFINDANEFLKVTQEIFIKYSISLLFQKYVVVVIEVSVCLLLIALLIIPIACYA